MARADEGTGDVIRINGQAVPLEVRFLAELLLQKGCAERQGIAAAVNGVVVPRGRWASHRLAPGDAVEIVTAVQGG